jgi:hypothetical protein
MANEISMLVPDKMKDRAKYWTLFFSSTGPAIYVKGRQHLPKRMG